MTGFTDEDVKKLREFGYLLNQKARFFDMSIPDSAKLISYLQFYNQLASKVEQHVLEVVNIRPKKEKADKKS